MCFYHVALDAVPTTTPHVVHHVTHGGARGVPRWRAHRATHILTPGVALGGVGPGIALGAAPILGYVVPATLAGGPNAPPLRIDINALFAFLE